MRHSAIAIDDRDDALPARSGARLVTAPLGSVLRASAASPLDALAILVVTSICATIIVNALMLQAGRHPAPWFAPTPALGALPPTPSSVVASRSQAEAGEVRRIAIDPVTPAASAAAVIATTPPPAAAPPPRSEATAIAPTPPAMPAVRSNVPPVAPATRTAATPPPRAATPMMAPPQPQSPAMTAAGVPRPPAPVGGNSSRSESSRPAAKPDSARRVAAMQRALSDFGYGQIKPDGIIGADTQAAIEKFERERRLPVTGRLSDRMLRDLASVTGRRID